MIDAREENRLIYQASSPDENALVNAARYFKYVFKSRDIDNNVELEIDGRTVNYQILNILEYSSDRKRMSVIVRCPDGKIKLFIKGADSVIREKISQNPQLLSITENHLLLFAREGLRTLMIAYKEISDDNYEAWNNEYKVSCI